MASDEQKNETKKVYPGQLEDFHELRTARETLQAEPQSELLGTQIAALAIAEQLAGLNYILDGIRYATRNRS